ncbi:MAG: hypothetical protein LAT64_04175 [Phycisphaerales bacterium]|nr:hypothetical protein [Planctomycetota bacterium]MCH8507949.1 hypothetical protein [Phycisphaerales bacterium]
MASRRTIHARAHAKINLALGVGPPEPAGSLHAGYHPIASWMHAVDLADDITLTEASETSFDIAWNDGQPAEWDLADDLCVRAHAAVERLAGRSLPVSVRVRKAIPAGGGLGGGSADAGAVMLALRDLFALDIDDAAMLAGAHALGTDITYFIDPLAWEAEQPPRPALVGGLGDRIERLARRGDPLTLLCPPFGCPTGTVYRAFDASLAEGGDGGRDTDACTEVLRAMIARDGIEPAALFNDLGEPAERAEPRLGAIRRAVADALALPVHVSGSGSTLFCFAPTERVRPHAPECRVIGTRLV